MPIKRGKRAAKTARAATRKSTVGTPSTRRPTRSTSESKPASAKGAARTHIGKKHGSKKAAKPRGVVRSAVASVGHALSRVTGRGKTTTKAVELSKGQKAARVAKRQTDIPMDTLAETYTPTQTSLKGPFRTSGADRQNDQEFARGVADTRWSDEDLFTNKSGDPRIGTHGRSYEPGEARAASGRKRNNE